MPDMMMDEIKQAIRKWGEPVATLYERTHRRHAAITALIALYEKVKRVRKIAFTNQDNLADVGGARGIHSLAKRIADLERRLTEYCELRADDRVHERLDALERRDERSRWVCQDCGGLGEWRKEGALQVFHCDKCDALRQAAEEAQADYAPGGSLDMDRNEPSCKHEFASSPPYIDSEDECIHCGKPAVLIDKDENWRPDADQDELKGLRSLVGLGREMLRDHPDDEAIEISLQQDEARLAELEKGADQDEPDVCPVCGGHIPPTSSAGMRQCLSCKTIATPEMWQQIREDHRKARLWDANAASVGAWNQIAESWLHHPGVEAVAKEAGGDIGAATAINVWIQELLDTDFEHHVIAERAREKEKELREPYQLTGHLATHRCAQRELIRYIIHGKESDT